MSYEEMQQPFPFRITAGQKEDFPSFLSLFTFPFTEGWVWGLDWRKESLADFIATKSRTTLFFLHSSFYLFFFFLRILFALCYHCEPKMNQQPK